LKLYISTEDGWGNVLDVGRSMHLDISIVWRKYIWLKEWKGIREFLDVEGGNSNGLLLKKTKLRLV